ncbi:MAG: SGNH/GDSL hydrolase family protein [Bacteroidales bacterium]|nr:SGNH/GDSL hydrolase family protein [Bacteroidales bacterium]
MVTKQSAAALSLLFFLSFNVNISGQEAISQTQSNASQVHNEAHNQALQTHQSHNELHNQALQTQTAHNQALQTHNAAHAQAQKDHLWAIEAANEFHNRAHMQSVEQMKRKRLKAQSQVQSVGAMALLNLKKEIPGDHSNIRYTGRIVKNEDGSVSFDWSGSYMELKFTGSFLAIKVSDTRKNYYNLFVNGVEQGVVETFGKDSVIVLASGLKGKNNVVRLQKRSEGEQGKSTIHTLYLSKTGKILEYNPGRTRHIEFIGNSLTVGFGTEGKSKDEKFLASTENCNLAFGAIISRYFNADYTLIAHSGWGAVRNYGDTSRVSRISMKDKMLQTFDMEPGQMWNFTSYKPDIVVINLGSNDFSTKPHPLKEEFLGAYSIIIDRLREKYGDVPILCVAPNRGPAFEYLQEFVRARADKRLHFTAYLQGVYNSDSDLGSVGHPNYSGQQKLAMVLIPYISTATGWALSPLPIR